MSGNAPQRKPVMVHDDSRPVLPGPRHRIELDGAEVLRLPAGVSG
ncbi:hypothetical protein [Streptomyces sp. NPDC059010]